jgi:hypothetical protein
MTATETQPKPFFPALAEDPRWTFVGTPAEYRTLAAKVRDYDVARETMYPGQHSFTPEELAAIGLPKPTNEERSAVEEYEFRTNKEERYFAYVNQETKTVTTWTGQPLGVTTAATSATPGWFTASSAPTGWSIRRSTIAVPGAIAGCGHGFGGGRSSWRPPPR